MLNAFKPLRAVLLGISLTIVSLSSYAIDLKQAKEQGLVGEQPNGYLSHVGQASEDVKQLINSVNQKRKHNYQQIAQKKGISLEEVEKIAGKVALEKTESGHYIQQNGQWVKK